MVEQPQNTVPQQAGGWAQTMGAYRFLNNDRVSVEQLQAPAIAHTRSRCAASSVVLCLHDLSPIDPVHEISDTTLQQHSVLAADGDTGQVLGLLHQRWFNDPKAPPRETRAQRRQRWTRSQVWPEAVEAVGTPPPASRWIAVADREADDVQFFHACLHRNQGFVVRSQHDRYLTDGGRLRDRLEQAPVIGGAYLDVPRRAKVGTKAAPKRRRSAASKRTAHVTIRTAHVTLAPPKQDNRYDQGLTVNMVQVREINPPEHVGEPLEWILLTTEPVANLTEAMRVIRWYARRWLIEEFHKAQKTGCRLEKSQLHNAEAIKRLAAITAVVAVRLVQLRDTADDPRVAEALALDHHDALWVEVVARLSGKSAGQLTMRQFYHGIARQGGWLARKGDGRPGWQTLWRGYQRIADYVTGFELLCQSPPYSCV